MKPTYLPLVQFRATTAQPSADKTDGPVAKPPSKQFQTGVARRWMLRSKARLQLAPAKVPAHPDRSQTPPLFVHIMPIPSHCLPDSLQAGGPSPKADKGTPRRGMEAPVQESTEEVLAAGEERQV